MRFHHLLLPFPCFLQGKQYLANEHQNQPFEVLSQDLQIQVYQTGPEYLLQFAFIFYQTDSFRLNDCIYSPSEILRISTLFEDFK